MSTFGYHIMKRLMRRHGDPIAAALNGAADADPSVVALVEQLRVAAGGEEALSVEAPIDAITEAVLSGTTPSETDLRPVDHSLRRRFLRFVTTAGLATKLLFGAAAIAAVTTTAAVTGSLPDGVQDFVSDSVDNIGIEIPRGHDDVGPPAELPTPSSSVPEGPIEYRDAVREYTLCVQDARREHIAEYGNARDFDATSVCDDRPDPADFPAPNAPGRENRPSDTRPASPQGPPEGTPADTRPGTP